MLRAPFAEQLRTCEQTNTSLVCVGLDPLPDMMPPGFDGAAGALAFCCRVVDATADLVSAFKPQAAHFGALGAERELKTLIEYIHTRHPAVPVILDAKRGDVGPTAERYAIEVFDRYGADAVTVNPYLGPESLRPFLKRADRGAFILCRTSNPENAWLQNHPEDDPAFLRVARTAAEWNVNGNVMLVVGATYPGELRLVRDAVGEMCLLLPGIGTQGGDVEAAVSAGINSSRSGLVVNASRSVLYASRDSGFDAAARAAVVSLRNDINRVRGVEM